MFFLILFNENVVLSTSDYKVKIQTTTGKMLQKGCYGQTAKSQAGTTSKGKLTNTKLLAPSMT